MTLPHPELPAAFVRDVSSTWRTSGGPEFIAELPERLARYTGKWDLRLGEAFAPLSFNYVTRVTRADGRPAVLKLGVPCDERTCEVEALRLWDGRGAVRVLEADAPGGALLLEMLIPGTPATDLDDDTATALAADIMANLRTPLSQPGGFPTVERWGRGFQRYRQAYMKGGPLRMATVAKAEQLFRDLCESSGPRLLLHGDLHHGNVLESARGWLAIDPKGVAGEAEYETGAWLRNPLHLERRPGARQLVDRRIAQLSDRLAFERERVRAWAFAQCVLSCIWAVEDGHADAGDIAGWESLIALFE
jgi:streptomycin 6-kinase